MLIKTGFDNINPWLCKMLELNGRKFWTGPTSTEDRLCKLKFFDSSKLREVIKWPGTQKAVRLKAEIFLRKRGINVNKSGS